jgi:hypothetical protein
VLLLALKLNYTPSQVSQLKAFRLIQFKPFSLSNVFHGDVRCRVYY